MLHITVKRCCYDEFTKQKLLLLCNSHIWNWLATQHIEIVHKALKESCHVLVSILSNRRREKNWYFRRIKFIRIYSHRMYTNQTMHFIIANDHLIINLSIQWLQWKCWSYMHYVKNNMCSLIFMLIVRIV